jgi:hypothetical protein
MFLICYHKDYGNCGKLQQLFIYRTLYASGNRIWTAGFPDAISIKVSCDVEYVRSIR